MSLGEVRVDRDSTKYRAMGNQSEIEVKLQRPSRMGEKYLMKLMLR
jgi:hypothetical protein